MSFSMISSMANFKSKKAAGGGGVSVTGQWVAVGGGGLIAYSPDGNDWSPAASNGGITFGYGVAFNEILYLRT